MIFYTLLACIGPKGIPEVEPVAQQDPGNTTEIPQTMLSGLNGVPPNQPVALPSFEVLNLDQTSRTQGDLQGHRSVIWFYPFANTPG